LRCRYIAPVDDDTSVRESLEALLTSAGWQVLTFATVSDFLVHARPCAPNCVALDVALPDLHGLDVQERLAREGAPRSVVFFTSQVARTLPDLVRMASRLGIA